MEWQRSSESEIKQDGSVGPRVSEYRSSLEMSMSTVMTLGELPELKEIQESFMEIFQKIDACVWDYRTTHNLPLSANEPFSVLKYANNAEYRTHWDSGPQNGRILSMVFYMNDGYEGGELEFPVFDYTYKPSAGSVVLFPSNYVYKHSAHPVTTGTKYSMVTWFR
jgi:predicted 2-oxoglutarate/Fe(II)-dependent dioxygenase YbiX